MADDDADRFLAAASARIDLSFASALLLPGDGPTLAEGAALGTGLRVLGGAVRSVLAGPTCYRPPHTYSVRAAGRQYWPRAGDQVVGVVEDRGGDAYRVNVFGAAPAQLGRLAFDGATKRNRPELRRGDVVYCRVEFAEKGLDTRTPPSPPPARPPS